MKFTDISTDMMYIFFMCAQDNEWHDLIFVAAAAAVDPEYEQTFAVFIRLRLRLEINNLLHHVNILSLSLRELKSSGGLGKESLAGLSLTL